MLRLDKLQKHTGVGRSYVTRISLSPRGLISITNGAVQRYGLLDKEWAELYYDSEDRIVALKPLVAKTDDALKLRKRDTGAYVAAQSFVGCFQIVLTKTTSYDLKIDTESGLLYFELDKGRERKAKL